MGATLRRMAAVAVVGLMAGCGPERVSVLGDEGARGARLAVDVESLGTLVLQQDMRHVPRAPGSNPGNLIGFFSVNGAELRLSRARHEVTAASTGGETLKTIIAPGAINAIYFDFVRDTAWSLVNDH